MVAAGSSPFRYYGQSVTFTATVTAAGSPVTSGTVDFEEGSAILASNVPLDASGDASFYDLDPLRVRESPVRTAVYDGTPQYGTSSASASQTVNPAPLAVTIGNDTQTYGARPTSPPICRPPSTPASTARILPSPTASSGDTAPQQSAATPSAAGLRRHAAWPADYTVTLTPGTLTVNPYAFSYTIGNDSQTYGSPANLTTDLPSTISTGVNGESLAHQPTAARRHHHRTAGGYAIDGRSSNGTGLAADYTVTLDPGTLTVNPAPSR